MRDVFGTRSWIFWWAALTSSLFLKDWLAQLGEFFRDSGVFTPEGFPFSLVAIVNSWIDGAATYIERNVQFNPSAPLVTSPILIPNLVLALFFGFLILMGAIGLYTRALSSGSVGDDIITLFILYFVIRVEAQIMTVANAGPLAALGVTLIQNQALSFWILMFLLFVLILMGEGIRTRHAFWRGMLEGTLVAILFFPLQTGQALGWLTDRLADFATLLQTSVIFGFIWGLLGMVLALTRLTNDAKTA